MQNIIKSWVRYFLFVVFFGVCINLIYLAIPIYMMVVYDKVLFSFSKATLFTLGAGVIISLIMMGLIDYFRRLLLVQAGNKLALSMLPFVFKSMQSDAAGSNGASYTRGVYDLELLRNAIVRGYLLDIFDLPWVLIYLGILYFVHPLVGMVAIAGVFLVTFSQVLLRVFEKKRYVLGHIAFTANADFVCICLSHAQIVSGMGMFDTAMAKYKGRYEKGLMVRSGADVFQAGIGVVIRLIQVFTIAGVFTAGAYVFFTDEITAGAVFATVLIIARAFYPFEKSLSGMKFSIEAMAAYRRLKQFVNTTVQKPKLSLPPPQGKVEAEGISLSLNARTILHNISFGLEPGETLGILGGSSAGKTSLCKVLLGVWPALAGKIRIDGAQIDQWSRDEFGTFAGYLPQETQLFPGTVAENIARLRIVDSEKVVQAAQRAGVHDMLLKLPQGYDTKIDQTGKNLGAGQRQLISLARAMYGDVKFVVMDEPQTHLDEHGLQMVGNALKNLKQEKITTLVVTDRPNLIVNMDKLLLIKEGQIAMYGPCKEVLAQLTNSQQPQQAAGV